MSLKSSVDALLNDFKLGKSAIDMTYKFNGNGDVEVVALSFHEPYVWDGKKDPVYINFNTESKSIYLSNLVYSDLKDDTINKFFMLPEDFGE